MVHNQEAVSRPINCIHHTNWPQSSSLCSGMNSWRTFIIGKESEWVMKLSHKWYQGITETFRTPVSGRLSSPKYAASSTDPKLVLFSWGDHWPCSMKDWGVESLQTQSKFDTHLKTAKYASMASLILRHFEEWPCSMGQCTYGEILGKIGWDPSVSKSNRLHVDTFWISSISSRCIL